VGDAFHIPCVITSVGYADKQQVYKASQRVEALLNPKEWTEDRKEVL
jgi:hypothetical protein